MNSTIQLINMLGAAALLVWGLRLIKTGIMRAFGPQLRQWIAKGTGNRFSSALSGLVATLALQSSTATAVITASFASRGIVNPRMGQAIMLGANVGTSIAAVILSLDVHWMGSALIFAGVMTFSLSRFSKGKSVGRALLGLGLMLLALQLLGEITVPLRESPVVISILKGLDDAPVFALAISAALAIMASSSLAVVLFVVLLAQAGIVSPPMAVILVAGANLGGAIPPFLAVAGEGVEARRLTLSNLVVRAIGAIALMVLARPVSAGLLALIPDPRMLTITTHIGFNLLLLVVFLPLLSPIAKLAARIVPAPTLSEKGPAYLDEAIIGTPSLALAGAARETLRVGDIILNMLEKSHVALQAADPAARSSLSDLDDEVDRLQQAIKLYLARLGRERLEPDDAKRAQEIISYAINLEHIGDIIDRGLSEQAAKKAQRMLSFSAEGMSEITELYERTLENLRLAQAVFLSRDADLARQLVASKVEVRRIEAISAEKHLIRMREGRSETMDTSSLHLDILRDLKRVNAHLTSVAYPILEEMGALRESRLRPAETRPT